MAQESVNVLMFNGRNRANTINGENFSLTFDLILRENHAWKLDVATHPVELGSPITDHIQKLLERGSLVGLISNFALSKGEITSNDAQDTFDLLEDYSNNVVAVTIVTTLKQYDNVIINSVGAGRDGSTGNAQEFQISFQEFREVQLSTTSLSTTQVRKPTKEDLLNSDDAKAKSKNVNSGKQGGIPRTFSSSKYSKAKKFTGTEVFN